MPTTIESRNIQTLLTDLVGRDVTLSAASKATVHPSTFRGLVTDENELVAVVACDLNFAHRSGAALAMIPAVNVSEPATAPDESLLEIYSEVSNVLSRLVNEVSPSRLRLDPDLTHTADSLRDLIAAGSLMAAVEADIEGYGSGTLAIWSLN